MEYGRGGNPTYGLGDTGGGSRRVRRAPLAAAGGARAAEVGALDRQAAESALAAIISPLPHYRGKPSALIAAIADS